MVKSDQPVELKIGIFSSDDLRKIEAAVTRIEKKTSGEIVPLIVPASDDYGWVHGVGAAIGWILSSLGYWLFVDRVLPWANPSSSHLFLWQSVGISVGILLGFFDFFKRWIVPQKWMERQVHIQCLANFLTGGLQETRDRTGVLIYISLLEHRVEILADKGIHLKVGNDYWVNEVELVVRGLKSGRPREALIEAIEGIGSKLAEYFPPRPDDQDELSNRPRQTHFHQD